MIKPLDTFLSEIDAAPWPLRSSATDYPADWFIQPHSHNKHQLIYAIQGVMVVHSAMNQWTVPPAAASGCPAGRCTPSAVWAR